MDQKTLINPLSNRPILADGKLAHKLRREGILPRMCADSPTLIYDTRNPIIVNKVARDQAINNEPQMGRHKTKYVINFHKSEEESSDRRILVTNGRLKHDLIHGLSALSEVIENDQVLLKQSFTDNCTAKDLLIRAQLFSVLMALKYIESLDDQSEISIDISNKSILEMIKKSDELHINLIEPIRNLSDRLDIRFLIN